MAKAKIASKQTATAKNSKAIGFQRGSPAPVKALPVTLLSGFLGSGKTTVLQQILRSEHGLRIAVIVNDIGEVNVDANLIRGTHRLTKTEEKVISLANGCICCTLRGDLLEELVRLAELAEFDYIIVESSGISEPEQVAETFDERLGEQIAAMGEGPEGLDQATLASLARIKEAGGLDKFARLDTTCTVIDAFTVFNDFETLDLLSDRRDDVTPEDERTVSDLMVDQIEFADVIVLNKIDLVSVKQRKKVLSLIKKLNHRAKIIESSYGRIDAREIVNTGMFNLEAAQTGYGWLQDLHAMTLREVNGYKTVTPKPETEEYNVRNFVYVRRRPFHPKRLFALLHDKFVLQHPFEEEEEEEEEEEGKDSEDESMEVDGEEDDDDDMNMDDPLDIPDPAVVLANKRSHPLFSKLFRSKGEYFLATRPDQAGEWSQAGAMLTLSGGRPWFCTIPRSEWESGIKEIDELVDHDIKNGGPYGDRRQELVFIGERLNIAGMESVLDECLLNDEEWAQWQAVMVKDDGPNSGTKESKAVKADELAELFDDGFPDWSPVGEEEEEEGSGMESDDDTLKRADSHSHPHPHPHSHDKSRSHLKSRADKNSMPKHGVRADGTVY